MTPITVVYIYPMLGGEHDHYAARFMTTYHRNPPGMGHKTIVISNGAPPSPVARLICSSIEDCQFVEHDDSGWDIGGFQKAASVMDTELGVYFGGNAFFERAGWLKRMYQSYTVHGRTLYGVFATWQPSLHVRTTGFMIPTELFRQYPFKITTPQARYDFEHRSNNVTEWLVRSGIKPVLVTWSGDYFPEKWSKTMGFYGTGIPSDCLISDRQCDSSGSIRPTRL